MPASENRKTVMATVSAGAYWNDSAEGLDLGRPVLRAMAMMTAKAPRFMTA